LTTDLYNDLPFIKRRSFFDNSIQKGESCIKPMFQRTMCEWAIF